MYEVTLGESWDLFGDFLEGARTAPVCAVASERLPERARRALASSVEALGYGPEACTFVALSAGEAGALDRQALFLLLEGLDPLCLVAADADAARALGEAYRCTLQTDAAQRLFGRPCVAFESFDAMLDDPQEKQRAWALLKRLPRFREQQIPHT